MAYNYKVEFDEPLLGCCNHMPSCLIVAFVPCGGIILQALTVQKATGENWVRPCCSTVFFMLFCGSLIGLVANRGEVRRAVNVQGSFLGDFFTYLFCGPCAICQEFREVERKRIRVH